MGTQFLCFLLPAVIHFHCVRRGPEARRLLLLLRRAHFDLLHGEFNPRFDWERVVINDNGALFVFYIQVNSSGRAIWFFIELLGRPVIAGCPMRCIPYS